jgi:hypothetical protein
MYTQESRLYGWHDEKSLFIFLSPFSNSYSKGKGHHRCTSLPLLSPCLWVSYTSLLAEQHLGTSIYISAPSTLWQVVDNGKMDHPQYADGSSSHRTLLEVVWWMVVLSQLLPVLALVPV